ncbi:MAG: proliferating cell nuclear antigen (pcna) [Candidatus Diapherotrites archaeon]|nr:proliferating cell nuclear antigen (pcna) [Candidatus Diapherotrites archaeon]
MRLVLEKADVFRKSVEALNALIDEAYFILTEKGLSLKATDPSQISMVDFQLDKGAFKEFSIDSQEKLGLDLTYLNQVMSRSKPNDSVVLELEGGSALLKLVFAGDSTRTFHIPLLDLSSSELPNPRIEFEAEVRVRAGLVVDGLKDAGLISTHVTLGVAPDAFYIQAKSSKGELFHEIKKEKNGLQDLHVKNECRAMFHLDYLSDMLRAAGSDNELVLKLKANAPVEVSYKLGEARLTYFLAPRIES